MENVFLNKRKWHYNPLFFKKGNGFTLPEVLITLAIIGIIAALTIPTLINNMNKQQYISAWKKAYGTAGQAYSYAVDEHGGGFGAYTCGFYPYADNIFNAFKSHLNVIRVCNTNTGAFGKCWAQSGTSPDTSISIVNLQLAHQNNQYAIATSDGMYWMLDALDGCPIVAVDINGEKPPNQWGQDTFSFLIDNTYIRPAPYGIDLTHNSINYLTQ